MRRGLLEKVNLLDRDGCCPKFLLHPTQQEIRPAVAQQVAEPAVSLREEGRLVEGRSILEAHKLHGFMPPGKNGLASHKPADDHYLFAHMPGQGNGRDTLNAGKPGTIEFQWVPGYEHTQRFHLMPQAYVRVIGRSLWNLEGACKQAW